MIDLFGSLITERFTIVDGRAGQTAWKTTNKMKVKHTTEERERGRARGDVHKRYRYISSK